MRVVNELSQPTAVHWHGIELESYPDGVPRSLAPYPEKSLYSILEGAARRHPSAPAIA